MRTGYIHNHPGSDRFEAHFVVRLGEVVHVCLYSTEHLACVQLVEAIKIIQVDFHGFFWPCQVHHAEVTGLNHVIHSLDDVRLRHHVVVDVGILMKLTLDEK